MSARSFPARIVYGLVALPVGGAAGFYISIWLLPELMKLLRGEDPGIEDQVYFLAALGLGAGLAFTASLVALTLPWIRHRRRSGRRTRIAISGIFVVAVSILFADWGHYALIYDLIFAAWLAYTMTYTYVRYGVLDSGRRRRRSSVYSDSDD